LHLLGSSVFSQLLVGASDGALDGWELGSALGIELSILLGSLDGALDGWELGMLVGNPLGILLGSLDGALDGWELGMLVGNPLGILLGSELGASDGDADGVLDCAALGASDGSSLGELDADADGVLDGASVGASVSVHSCAVCGDSHPATHSYPAAQPQVQSVEPAVSKQIPPSPLSHPCESSLHGWNVGALLGSELGASDGDADGVLDCAAVGASDGSSHPCIESRGSHHSTIIVSPTVLLKKACISSSVYPSSGTKSIFVPYAAQ